MPAHCEARERRARAGSLGGGSGAEGGVAEPKAQPGGCAFSTININLTQIKRI